MDRRDFLLNLSLVSASASVCGCGSRKAVEQESGGGSGPSDADLAWGKAPCRYCGTGCGVEVGVSDGKVLAVRGDTASPRTVEMCPVNVSLNCPEARSQILMVLSPAPLANHLFSGSTASARTQPRCPETTRISFHGLCHSGLTCWGMSCLRIRLVCSGAPRA